MDTDASTTEPTTSPTTEQTPSIAADSASDAKTAPGLPRWLLRGGLVCSVIACGLIVLADYLAMAPNGTNGLKAFTWLLFLPAMGCVIFIPMFLRTAISRMSRRTGSQLLLVSTLFAAAVFLGFHLGGKVRMGAFRELALRSTPLVEAIKAYERDQGTPPPDLNALVPQYLAAVPGTGIACSPAYTYYVGNDAARIFGHPWVLAVEAPRGITDWEMLLYFPNQDYSGLLWGDPLKPIEGWALRDD